MSTETPSRKHLHLDLDPNFVENAVMTCPLVPSAMLPTPNAMPGDLDVEPSDIRRLMGAVSFGYGIFQLCSSLLPPKILKIFNFLGFVGVQSAGISCLMYSRSTNDVRSVMATWVMHGRWQGGVEMKLNMNIFSFCVQVCAVVVLHIRHAIVSGRRWLCKGQNFSGHRAIERVQWEKSECRTVAVFSRPFGTHEGNYHRSIGFTHYFTHLILPLNVTTIQANIVSAIEYFENSCTHSAQMELKLLCLHEMAWCNLIRLDFETSANQFDNLRYCSSFSRAFYSYMACVCHGAAGNFTELTIYKNEIDNMTVNSKFKVRHAWWAN